ncbi:MAG TPA: hypothetical protein PKC22_01665, partial [Rhodocyclaceae bacterium]|nr:hypothetical protein [Rhodocyclaceae bacterium]
MSTLISPLVDLLADCRTIVASADPFQVSGRLTRVNGLVMEAAGLRLAIGSGCQTVTPGIPPVEAEVVGFHGDRLFMMPTEDVQGVAPGAQVLPMEPGLH